MKHAFAAPLALFVLLAGCAAEERTDGVHDMSFTAEVRPEVREARLFTQANVRTPPIDEAKTPAGGSEAKPPETPDAREQALRRERQEYARGLEKILASHGMSVGVLAYEGQSGPAPTLMFIGGLSREFVERAVTTGAVLERARALGFRSADFFDRGPDSHYRFVLSKTGPLPKCAAHSRLCLP
jgi:hypothetical protein